MTAARTVPVALTIAGSDSGGGAGIQADLKTFAALAVHGTSAITSLTAQNPKRVSAIHPCPPNFVCAQIEAVFAEFAPAAVKTGMLYNAGIVREVIATIRRYPGVPLIVDPVMVATSGTHLLRPDAIRLVRDRLLPLASVVTPNLPEAELLLGNRIRTVEALRRAARAIHARFGCAALVKGGHLPNVAEAIDFFYDGETELLLRAPFIKGVSTHGTGCTYSAAIAAYCARGFDLPRAVGSAKSYITSAIAGSHRAGRHTVLAVPSK